MRLMLAMAVLAGGASAEGWSVERLGGPGPGDGYCVAETRNAAGQGLVLLKDGVSAPLIEWARDAAEPPRPEESGIGIVTVRLTFDVGYDRWRLDAADDYNRVGARVGDPADWERLGEQMAAATALAVIGDGEERLALFSLEGAGAALGELEACWRGL